ncbi:hypothetical protein D9757_000018 [Collybiopsis confluens]|uniref:CCHC-type domain-containing protein n=1 Tax=Collybiopsis confluens TaxID=2823264 RepID=A0A8H5MH71_9AGAR|nr:hypothetical protein D9757_000018 [Collybiopsis confluens]
MSHIPDPSEMAVPESHPQADPQPQASDIDVLRSIVEMGRALLDLNTNQSSMVTRLQSLTDAIAVQQQNNSQFTASMVSLSKNLKTLSTTVDDISNHSSSSSFSSSIKFNPPTVFTGNATEVKDFLSDIQNSITLQHKSFPSDLHRTIFMSMYLAYGTPKMWFNGLSTIIKSDFKLFCQAFENHFGDSDPKGTANSQLQALRQEHCGSTANYYSRYSELRSRVDWTDFTLIDTFTQGLKPRVKDALKFVLPEVRPKVFDAFASMCVKYDNLAWKEEQNAKRERGDPFSAEASEPAPPSFTAQFGQTFAPPASSFTPIYSPPNQTPYSHSNFNYSFPSSAPTPSSSSLPDPVPMEVDAMKPNRPRGPLSEAERTDRLAKGLCLYCGIGGHVKDDCPNRSAQAITRANAKNSTKSSALSPKSS